MLFIRREVTLCLIIESHFLEKCVINNVFYLNFRSLAWQFIWEVRCSLTLVVYSHWAHFKSVGPTLDFFFRLATGADGSSTVCGLLAGAGRLLVKLLMLLLGSEDRRSSMILFDCCWCWFGVTGSRLSNIGGLAANEYSDPLELIGSELTDIWSSSRWLLPPINPPLLRKSTGIPTPLWLTGRVVESGRLSNSFWPSSDSGADSSEPELTPDEQLEELEGVQLDESGDMATADMLWGWLLLIWCWLLLLIWWWDGGVLVDTGTIPKNINIQKNVHFHKKKNALCKRQTYFLLSFFYTLVMNRRNGLICEVLV